MLNKNEQKSLKKYTEESYEWINEYLLKDKGNKDIEQLVAVLSKLSNYERITYRATCMSESALKKYEEARQNESYIIEPTFISTSRSQLVATGYMRYEKDKTRVLFEIAGTTGKSIEKYSKYPNEQEVLFAPNTRFSVDEIIYENNKVRIRLFEI